MAGRTPQKSCEAKPRVLSCQGLLEEEDPGPLSQELQATCSKGGVPLNNLGLSHASLETLEYLPFYRTYGQLLAEEELAPQPEAASAGPDLVPGSSHSAPCCSLLLVSAGPARDSGLDTPLSSDAAFRGHALCASGFVPYYRTPEEGLHTSPGPPAALAGGQELTGEPPRPGAATL
ncbi:hypothetical protein HPG69_017043 [Diceros bicornis minor]|uniref:Uncharacterized protein n=1 Tax=Diceros bicornis minor TaxID=77932 RepID=A0A7J7EC86_DICBM|nr:hypothetical protein HPG69_017043 [Diceros bicornis minor]